jgi:hypothetical protein
MEQKTGVSSLYDEFSRSYWAEIGLCCPEFRPKSAYTSTSAISCRMLVLATNSDETPRFSGAFGLVPAFGSIATHGP